MANTTTQFTIKINGTEQLVTLDNLINQNATSLGELKDQQNALQQAFDQADYGSAAFNQLQSELRGVNTQIKVIDESVADLTIGEKFEGVGRIAGAVGGAFAFATVSVQAFGEENSKTAEELQKLETQISAIIQGQQALTGIIDAFGSKNKIVAATLNLLSKGFNAVGISAKGAGFAIRGALIATGIGVLVAGVSFLIANFDDIKSAGAGIFKAWQPFFDGVRNFASTLTFGLIDSANVAKIKSQADDISESITKSQEKSSKELDAINTKFELRQINSLQKAQEVFNAITNNVDSLKAKNIKLLDTLLNDKDVKDFEDKVQEVIEYFSQNVINDDALQKQQIKKVIQIKALLKDVQNERNKLNTLVQSGLITDTDLKKLDTIKKKNEDILKIYNSLLLNTQDILAGGSVLFNNVPVIENAKIQQNILLTQKGITTQIEEQNKAKKASIDKSDIEIQQANALAQTQKEILNLQQQINQEQNKRSEDNNDLLKQGIDLILSFGNALKSPEFTKDLPVFKNFKEQLQFISKNLKGTFKGIFDDILKQSPETIVSVETLTKAIKAFGEEKIRTSTLNRQTAITNLQAEIDLNKELIKNSTDKNFIDVTNKKNELIKEQIKTLRDSAQKTKDEILGATQVLISSITRTVDAAKFEDQARQLEKAKKAFEDYKNGLQLTVKQSELLFNTFGVSSTEAFDKLDEATKNAVESNLTNKYIEQLTKLKEQAKDLAVRFPEVQNAVNQYTDGIDEATQALINNDKASKERIKSLNEELSLLEKQAKITKNQVVAQRPAGTLKQFEEQKKAINENGKLQKEIITDNFKAETKGLEDTDIRYKIAIQKRDTLLQEVTDSTIKQLDDAREAFRKLIINSIGDILNSVGQVSDALFQAQTEAIDRQITLNQYAIDTLSEQIAAIQEQISFIDEIINQRKAAIDELQQAAESSTGGQREEILKQLDAEVKRTKDLVKEKRALQKQEENAAKAQQKLEKDSQKLQAQSIVLQQKQAVAAQILGLAQTAVAIATIAASSARQDFTFGIATVASIVAVAGALAINIIGINNALKNLNTAEANPILGPAEGGFASDYQPMAKGGYTPMKGKGRDRTGEDAVGTYMLHANEYVVPRWMVESAKYGSMVNEMETARKRGFAQGGSPVPLRQVDVDANQEISLLLRANLNKPVFVAVTDINDGQSRVNVIENRARF
jgi:hypothetical protein